MSVSRVAPDGDRLGTRAPGSCLHAVGEGDHRFYAKEACDAMGKLF